MLSQRNRYRYREISIPQCNQLYSIILFIARPIQTATKKTLRGLGLLQVLAVIWLLLSMPTIPVQRAGNILDPFIAAVT